jgi:hypothetical protein
MVIRSNYEKKGKNLRFNSYFIEITAPFRASNYAFKAIYDLISSHVAV